MSMIDSIRYRIGILFRPRGHDREIAEEMNFHLELEAMQQSHRASDARAGADAPYAARRRFGNVTYYREESRHASGLNWFDTLWQDARFAFRTFRRAPSFTLVVVATLAIGIGANTAIFSVLNALLLQPLPFRDPARLMNITLTTPRFGAANARDGVSWSVPKFDVLRHAQSAFENVTIARGTQMTVRVGDDALREGGEVVDASFFSTLGVAPQLGRGFLPSDDVRGAPPAMVLSDAFWRRALNADPSVLGRTAHIDLGTFTIVGVMPPRFDGIFGQASFWITTAGLLAAWDTYSLDAYQHDFLAIGRRAPGISEERALMVVREVGKRVDAAFPSPRNPGEHWGATVRPLDTLRIDDGVRRTIWILFGAVALVLLIACANVANLFLVRASSRRREIAVRLSLGASRGRLVRQLLVESVLLALIGGALATLIAWAGVSVLASTFQLHDAGGLGAISFDSIHLDRSALAFTAGVALLTGVLFGLVPALQSTKLSLASSLKDDAAGWMGRLRGLTSRNVLTVVELALAVVLLAGSGLMIRSLRRLTGIEPGFDPRQVLTLRVNRSPAWSRDSISRFYDVALARLGSIPGVTQAAMTDCPPLGGWCGGRAGIVALDRPPVPRGTAPAAGIHWITPNWPEVMRIPLRRGRMLDRHDDVHSRHVALITETGARQLWPGEDPIGRPIASEGGHDTLWVVGVIGDVRYGSLADRPYPEVFVSYYQAPMSYRMMFFLRTRNEPTQYASAVRSALREVAPGFPMYDVASMQSRVGSTIAFASAAASLLSLFASIAVILATIGTYGVISFAVAQRKREMGVRLALGATAGDVTRLVVGQGVMLGAVGLACGLAASFVATPVLRSMLFGVEPTDPVTYVAIVGVLAVAVVAASLIPARRAASASGMSALLRGDS